MKRGPIVPARIAFGALPFAPDFGDVYHPAIGAAEQARHVFLGGNGLPARWGGRERFVIAETGFGLGNNFVATWRAWRDDPARCRRLVYVGIEAHPPRREDLARVHGDSPLVAAWPPLVPGLHTLDFEGGAVRLLLAFGDVHALLPELRFMADAFYLDGFAPARNPAMWERGMMQALGRRAARDATAATWSVAREVRDALAAAGFEVTRAPGIGGKREITVARFAPRFPPAAATTPPADVAVVGAGLAGAFVARALADEGIAVRVFDRQPAPAAETSGNPAGIYHGTVHAEDGPHARWLRAAALQAARCIAPVAPPQGLLRLAELGTMQALIERHALPPDWVQALDRDEASHRAGVPLPGAAWWFPQGGWAAPGALVRAALQGLPFVGGTHVHRIEAAGEGWRLLAADGHMIDEAQAVVLANAADAVRLLAPWQPGWPLQRLRGQVTGWQGQRTPLRCAVAGKGYAVPLADGLLCGATQSEDDDPAARTLDDDDNLARLQQLTGLAAPSTGRIARVGWRITAEDRLPVAGALPDPQHAGRADQARLWSRVRGLHVCTALGGRGITAAPLLGRLLAAQIAGSPWPVEQSLADALDPARWRVRAARRRQG